MSTSRPNVLLILSDQHHAGVIEGEGDPFARTPALRRLADRGIVFENCCCGSPLCVPSRMSFMTGRHCHRLGVWGNGDELPSQVPTFAHALGLAGYRTVLAGRMHFVGADQHHGFAERLVGDLCGGFLGQNRAEYRFRGFFGTAEAVLNAGPGFSHDLAYDRAVAAETCRVIRDHEVARDPRPLLLVAGFYSPHDPYRVPERWFAPFRGTADLPADPDGQRLHPRDRRRRERAGFASIPEAAVRNARAAYRGKVAWLDELVEMLMACWDESPLSRDGLLLYTSDHGEMLGEHGLWGKSTFHEAAVRVPLIIAGAGIPRAARVAAPVSLLDLAPTLTEIAGGEPLPACDGLSLAGALRGGPAPDRPAVFSELGGNLRMVRCGPWKYVHSHGEDPELLNLAVDPNDGDNLAGRAEHAQVEDRLRSLVFSDGWDPGRHRALQDARRADRAMLTRWAQATNPRDPVQWGLPAEL